MSNPFLEKVSAEFERAAKLHGPMHSAHEAFAVILEEVEEFKAEVFKKRPDRENMLTELVQIAAMCAKTVDNLNLMK